MARREAVIGVDIGTTSAKAVAFTVEGVARASGRAGYELYNPHPGWAEQDPEAVLAATLEATAEAVRGAREARLEVQGLAFGAAMHSLIALDESTTAISRVLTWADARAADQAARLRNDSRGLALHRRTGTPIHPMSPLVKLRWYRENEPELAARAQHWVGVKELVLQRLTGALVVDHGIASGMGMFNLRDEAWDGDALAYAGVVPEQLARLVATTEVLRLNAEGARAVGLPAGTPLVAGSSDGPLANLGLGAIRPGAVACSIGTSGALRVVADEPRVDSRGRVFCYVLAPGRYVIGGAVNNGGIVLDWLAETVARQLADDARGAGRAPAEALLEAAGRAAAGSGGLLFLPQLLGERAPDWAGDPRGAWVGLTRAHGLEHLLRAAVEGVCMQLAIVLGALGDAGVEVREIRATGGFTRSALWRAILAGVLGRPIGFAASPEGSSLGAALLGMTSLGMLESLDRAAELVAVTHVERPDPADAEAYARLLPHFESAYAALSPTSAALADLQDVLPVAPQRDARGHRPPGHRRAPDGG